MSDFDAKVGLCLSMATTTSPLRRDGRSSQGRFSGSQIDFWAYLVAKHGRKKKVEIEWVGPPQRDAPRNSLQDAGLDVKNGGWRPPIW